VNNLNLGLLTTYTPTSPLLWGTKYYWHVTPYNSGGDAVGIPLWNFTTNSTYSTSVTDLSAGTYGLINPSFLIEYISGDPHTSITWNPDFETTLDDVGLVIQLSNASYSFQKIIIYPDLGYIPDWVACRILPNDWFVISAYPWWNESSVYFDMFDPSMGGKNGSKDLEEVHIIFARRNDFPAAASTPVDIGGGVFITINPTVPLNYAADQTLPPLPSAGFSPLYHANLTGSGIVDIVIETDAPWGAYRQAGLWNAVANAGTSITFSNVDFDAKGDVPIVLGDTNPTLPVTLSAFSAVPAADYNSVILRWTVESETNHLGYDILRSFDGDLSNAIRVNSSIINEGTHNGSQINYRYNDADLYSGETYYYWLVSVSLDSQMEYFGPMTVSLTAPTDGNVPILVSNMSNAYPNPFKQRNTTTINVTVKDGESGFVNIYNITGQLVKTFSVKEGLNPLVWNGNDSKGNVCGSGIYFYKLSTPSVSNTKKMVIVK